MGNEIGSSQSCFLIASVAHRQRIFIYEISFSAARVTGSSMRVRKVEISNDEGRASSFSASKAGSP